MVSEKAERLIADAAAQGSQLVVFPEAFIGGYPRGNTFGVVIGTRTPKGKEDFRKYHGSAIDVPGESPPPCFALHSLALAQYFAATRIERVDFEMATL